MTGELVTVYIYPPAFKVFEGGQIFSPHLFNYFQSCIIKIAWDEELLYILLYPAILQVERCC